MTKTSETFAVLQLYRDALKKAICVKKFHIEGDGKTFDYELKDEKEYKCDDCKSEFCFKSLEWINDCGDGASKDGMETPKKIKDGKQILKSVEIEYERAYT